MSHKEYTITVDGSSHENVIKAPFKIMVNDINYNGSKMVLGTCTCPSVGVNCHNDDVDSILINELPEMSSSKNADLSATIEVLLESKYPGNWS